MSQRMTNEQRKERIRERIRVHIDEQNYAFFPEKKEHDYYDNDVFQRVGVYVRVSTDDIRQTTSYELQKKYYEDFVVRHPKWELVKIYADEGISGTSLAHRDEFNNMIEDCKKGKLTLLITKSVSRFARNVVDFLGMVRMLSERIPPIGVFFEAENIFSLNETSTMALSFQATMAEEESRNKSRSMETSLRMRLDHGLPLTPKLLGFMHNEYGKLIPNPETAHIPKLMYFMYLYGYSTKHIAEALTDLGKKTFRGNTKWTPGGVVQTMRNERYCGDVYTRKTFTPDVLSHRSIKNRGERPRSHYYNEHASIVSRDDFIAVQHLLNNSKYRNNSFLPELLVIKEGLLKGFVIINPRWGGFKEQEYVAASASAYDGNDTPANTNRELRIEVDAGDFDLRKFEVAHADLFGDLQNPNVSFYNEKIKFSTECVRKLQSDIYVEFLIHPTKRQFAVRSTTKDNRNAVVWAKITSGQKNPKDISCAAYFDTIYKLFEWNPDYKYRMYSSLYTNGSEQAYIFRAGDATAYILPHNLKGKSSADSPIKPINKSGKRIGAIPADRSHSFGNEFYLEQSYAKLESQTREEWKIRVEGQLSNVGMQLNVTDYEELRRFIKQELGDWKPKEEAFDEL